MAKFIEYRQLANILAMFLIVQLSGLLITFYLITPSQVSIGVGQGGSTGQVALFFVYLIVTAVIMYFLFKRHRGPLLFRGIEFLVIVSATFYLFMIILYSLFPQNLAYGTFASLLLAVGLAVAKNIWQKLRNLVAIIASVGVGVVLGLYFTPFFTAFMLMALVAVYDYVAVFVTKHMVTLGRESVNRNLAFMVGTYDVEVFPKGYLKGSEASKMRKMFSNMDNPQLKQLIKSGNVPMPSFSALGAGDLALPLMLAVSAYLSFLNYVLSLTITLGASVGLIFAMYVSKRYGIALPAIPPLFAFSNIALGLEILVAAPANPSLYLPLLATSAIVLAVIFYTAKRESAKGAQMRITAPG